jgi:hypothetical protein
MDYSDDIDIDNIASMLDGLILMIVIRKLYKLFKLDNKTIENKT